ncbi:uncharacterized protein METZ01_LOCUS309380 [marine metagenome]|uniref:Bacterial transcriptional activator domain-containing protein n=1 Tax=marine metagenome TaxID=408172 RepID=A0A382N625_9ZZZZ
MRQHPGENSLYHLIGLAQDALGSSARAVQSYRRFLSTPGIPHALRNRLQQRIAELSSP